MRARGWGTIKLPPNSARCREEREVENNRLLGGLQGVARGARCLGDQEAVSRPKTSSKTSSDELEKQLLGGSPRDRDQETHARL